MRPAALAAALAPDASTTKQGVRVLGACDHPHHRDRPPLIEPDDMSDPPPRQTAHPAVVAVDHPALAGHSTLNPLRKFLGIGFRRRPPPRLPLARRPLERVELDIWPHMWQPSVPASAFVKVVSPAPEVPTTAIRMATRAQSDFAASILSHKCEKP
jgi:hypothetical protein